MTTQQIRNRITYWSKRQCPKQAAAWRQLLQDRLQPVTVTFTFPAHKG